MRTCVALLFVSVMVVLATAEGNKNEKNVEEWTSRVGRGTPNRNKVNLKRDRKRIKPTRQRNGPGRRSKKINHKISKPGVRVEISNRGNLQRTKNFENVKATLKQKNPPFPACSYLDFGKITAEGKDCSKDGYKFVVKGPTGVRKQFLHVDDRVILAFVATGEKFATCTKFEDITGQVECKIVGGLAGTILNTKKDLKKADNFDACSYLDLGQITVQGTDCSNDGYKFVVKGKPKGVRKQFLHVDNKVIVAFVAPGDDNKFANCPAFQDITAQVTCTKVDGLAGTKLDNVVSGSDFDSILLLGGKRIGNTDTAIDTVALVEPCSNIATSRLTNPFMNSAASFYDNSIYICGGWDDTSSKQLCYVRDVETGNETPGPRMNKRRSYFTLNTLGTKLVAVGGFDYVADPLKFDFLDTVEVLESSDSVWKTQTWKIKPPRHGHCTVTINSNDVILVGGADSFLTVVTKTQQLDITTGSVTELAELDSLYGAIACSLYQDKLVVSGGISGGQYSDKVLTLDYSNPGSVWEEGPKLLSPRKGHAMFVIKGVLTVAGGDSLTNEQLIDGKWVAGEPNFANYRPEPASVGLLC